MKRIGLFGGSFDPVHYGHLLLAQCACEQLRLEKVIFMPAGKPPHKQRRRLASDRDRLAMLRLAVEDNSRFMVSDYELISNRVNFTVLTLEYLTREMPQAKFFLLLGNDMLHDFPTWRTPWRIAELATLTVIGRAGEQTYDFGFLRECMTPDQIKRMIACRVEMPAVGFSSSEIRQRRREERSVRYQVPENVREYILAHNLYLG